MRKRPKSPKTNQKGKNAAILQVNLNKAEAAKVKLAAKRETRSVSNWIKQLILREFEDATRSTDDDQEDYGSDFDKSPAVKPQPPLPFTPGVPKKPDTGSA